MRIKTTNITSAFFCLPKIALDRLPQLSGGDLKVYLNICSRQDNVTHTCYPSLTRIAEDTETSEKTASRSVNKLEELGLIEITRTAEGNVYRVIYEVEGSPILSTLPAENDRQPCPPGVDENVHRGVDKAVHLTILSSTTLSEQDSLSSSSLTADEPKKLKEPKAKSYKFDERDMLYAQRMLERILKVKPNFKKPSTLEPWANEVRLMRTQDKRSYEAIGKVFKWANEHHFWKSQILSAGKLREKFDQLELQMEGRAPIAVVAREKFKPSNVVNSLRNLHAE